MQNKTLFRLSLNLFAAIVLLGVDAPSPAQPMDEDPSVVFDFSEPSRGGTLHLVHKRPTAHTEILVHTTPNESHDEIRAAVKSGLLSFPLEKFLVSVATETVPDYREKWKSENRLVVPGFRGEIILGGTETGLGILPPVGSVSAGFDRQSQRNTFRWHEKSEYTEVYLCALGGVGFPVVRGQNVMRGEPFASVPAEKDLAWRHRYFYVVGFKDGLPTNASYIFASDTVQIEYFYHPFTNGIASNWTGWRLDGAAVPAFKEKIYPDMEKITKSEAADTGRKWEVVSRCAQLIQSEEQSGGGGMYRFFIAQTPGRVYRPALRCHIMEEAEDFKGEWAFEVMTGVIDPGRAYEMDYATRVLDGDYWAELEANGEQISKWRFDHTMPRTEEWIMNQTGAQDSDIPQKDIVLGDSKTAVFFCVRLVGHKPNGIAMDGVRLVDVTDGFVNAHTRERFL